MWNQCFVLKSYSFIERYRNIFVDFELNPINLLMYATGIRS